MVISEKQIENSILEYLYANGIFCWKAQTTGVYDQRIKGYRARNNAFHIRGVCDVLGILPDGKFLGVEVKRPGIKGVQSKGRLSSHQLQFLENIKKRGGVAFVAYSIGDVERELIEYLKITR